MQEKQYKPVLPGSDGLQQYCGMFRLLRSSFLWQIYNSALNTTQGQFS